MGKVIEGRYVYSLDDCRCDFCLYFDSKAHLCRSDGCCCLEEKREAVLHFSPDGFERKEAA